MDYEPVEDNTEIAVLIYGVTATILSTLPTYLWHLKFKNSNSLNQVGFKVSAYSSTYFWLPTALLTPLIFLFDNFKFIDYFITAMKISVAGPWGFNLLSLFYLVEFSSNLSTSSIILFGVYNSVLMIYQLVTIPLVQSYAIRKLDFVKIVPENGYDQEPVPVIENQTYATDYSEADPATWYDFDNWSEDEH